MLIRLTRNKKAQSTLEYAILISVVVAALLAMRIYVKRGYQGNLRKSADSMGDQYATGTATNTVAQTYSKTSEKAVPVQSTFLGIPIPGMYKQTTGGAMWSESKQEGSETGVKVDDDFWPDKMDAGAGLGK